MITMAKFQYIFYHFLLVLTKSSFLGESGTLNANFTYLIVVCPPTVREEKP